MGKPKGLKVVAPQKRKPEESNNGAALQKRRKREEAIKKACEHGIEWLLEGNDLSAAKFRAEYFEKKPLHIQRPDRNFYNIFQELCTPEGLFGMLDSGEVAVSRLNMFRCIDGSNKEVPMPPPQSAADVRRLFSEGWSIQWLQPQQEHAILARFVATLESQFGCLVGVNSYLTPPGTQGLAPHWDDVEVFVLQVAGSKAWQLHTSSSVSNLPPESQTLPRYSSGDLPLASLSPVLMSPTLKAGDLLYFPRGTIHHAPNASRGEPSIHLTVSAFQRQTYFDLTNKAFEEVMSELWENDESMRKTIPWTALGGASKQYPELCSRVAALLRRSADLIEEEAKAAAKGEADAGHVAGALADISSDFVQSRMPPLLRQPDQEVGSIISPASYVQLLDPTALAIVPAPGDDEGSAAIVHCLQNSQQDHMMKRGASMPPGGVPGEGDDDEEEEEEEGDDDGDDEEEDNDEPALANDEDDSDEAEEGWRVSAGSAAALRHLCNHSAQLPLSSGVKGTAAISVREALEAAKVPQTSWVEVCGVLTQLAALGLLVAQPSPPNGGTGAVKSANAAPKAESATGAGAAKGKRRHQEKKKGAAA